MKALFSSLSALFIPNRVCGAAALFAVTFFVYLFGAHPALADALTAPPAVAGALTAHPAIATTVGAVLCNVANNMWPFIDVFNWTAYTASVVIIIQGILHFHKHNEFGAQQYPHHKTFAMLTAGALLTVLPTVVATLFSTLFTGTGDGGSLKACLSASGPAEIKAAATSTGLDGMMAKFVNDIADPMTGLVSVVATVLGVFLILRGLMKAAKYGNDPRTHSITHILANLIIGCILISTSQGVDMLMTSLFGDSSIKEFSDLKWAGLDDLGNSAQFKAAVQAALTFFQLVGLISFVRGWNVIRNAVEGQGQATFAQGMTHVIGGILAMNIYLFMQIFDTTFGTKFLT